jgi:hypothetical protein
MVVLASDLAAPPFLQTVQASVLNGLATVLKRLPLLLTALVADMGVLAPDLRALLRHLGAQATHQAGVVRR